MTERSTGEQEPSPEWKEQIEQAIGSAIEFYPTPQDHDLPGARIIDMNPVSLTEGEDERFFENLSEGEKEFIKSILFRKLNPKLKNTQTVDLQGRLGTEVVYSTTQVDMFLHEILQGEGKNSVIIDYFLTNESFVL